MDYLEYLTQVLKCEYLSDLHFRTITAEQARALQALDPDMFDPQDYLRAARYLVGDGAGGATPQEARGTVLAYLQKPKE